MIPKQINMPSLKTSYHSAFTRVLHLFYFSFLHFANLEISYFPEISEIPDSIFVLPLDLVTIPCFKKKSLKFVYPKLLTNFFV